MIRSKKTIAIPPGYTIKEQLEDRGITQKEFALRMDLSEKHISKLINGEVLLTTDVAFRLEMVLGVPADFWLNLESIYRESIKRIEIENNLEEDILIASKFPYSKMCNLNWVNKAETKEEKVINLRKFFEVSRLSLIFENDKLNVLCRRLNETEKSDYALLAWAQKAKLEARNINTSSLNVNKLKDKLNDFRKLTILDPDEFSKKLVNDLSSCGVALVLLPHIESSYIHGATFYDGNKIVLALSLRGKDSDKFWFSFFHEIAHIILGHINLDYSDEMEIEADEFSKNVLIPKNEYDAFIKNGIFTKVSIFNFSINMGINCGIVVGRLQKEGFISYSSLNDLKTKYEL